MRTLAVVAVTAAASIFSAPAALATVNYGDFIGTDVDFLQVSETTQTAGDPEPIWDAPALAGTGNQLVFFPSAFVSECLTGGSDTTESTLTTTIEAQSGVNIEVISLTESGDVTLNSFPPFGDPSTNASTALSGTVTVTETVSGPIAPVVIPFTGSFTPSDSFALPVDFGLQNWSGSIDVDVASVVPLATKAELSLTNTLTSNCGASTNTSASIQKKVVNGPAVALAVNPLECDVALEKTCCVPRPVLPDLDICEGDVIRAVFEFTGDSCKASSNDQGKKAKCWGRRKIGEPAHIDILKNASTVSATPDDDIHIGDTVEFSSSTGTLPDKLKFKIRGPWYRRQYQRIITSCDRALKCGDQFGALKLVELETTEGGLVDCSAPPPEPECAPDGDPPGTPCDDKIVDMVLEYVGQDCQDPLGNPQSGKASCVGNATGASHVGIQYTGPFGFKQTVLPSSGINDGDRIRVTSTWWGGLFPLQEYQITSSSGVLQTVKFKVSCSEPLALGDDFGSLKVVEFTTRSGNTFALGDGTNGQQEECEVPLAPPGPHCTDYIDGLTLVYIGDFLGEGCTVSNAQGGYGSCTGDDDPGDPVSVSTGATSEISPETDIEFGDLVTITRPSGGALPGIVTLKVGGAGGKQTLKIKTSCWKPLSLGDRFGSFVVFGLDRRHDGPIELGGNIQYQYEVTNPNTGQLDNVAVNDDQLGEIVSGVSLAPGEMQTYVRNATLFGTTTNVATATGDVSGDICKPGVDQVTVTVLPPPPGPFHCSEPITELTMIWDGAEPVDVFAWDGSPGSSTLLAQFNDVPPGSAVTVDGLGEHQYPVWEVFNSTQTVRFGESSFDLWCRDRDMNGVRDCGKRQGNLKQNYGHLVNDWLLEGMVDSDETLSCTPGPVPSVEACGLGPELLFVLPGLLWLHRRRMRYGV